MYDISNKKYNKLTAVNFVRRSGSNYYWLFRCECGKEKVICRSVVIAGQQKSCGCGKEEYYNSLKNRESRLVNCWKGDNASYYAIHKYINKHFPKKGVCDNCNEPKKRTEYAIIHGKKYTRNREDYFELCCKCHTLYDLGKIKI